VGKITERITDTGTWAASSDLTPIDLPKDGLITQVGIRFAVTMSAAMTAVQDDGLRRAIEGLSIEGEGRTYLSLSGEQSGRLLAVANLLDFGTLSSLALGTTEHLTWIFHPGSMPRNPFDTSVVIPAQDHGTLQVKISTGAAADIDDTATISSGTYYLWIDKVTEVPKVNGRTPNLMVPDNSTQVLAHDANYSNYSWEKDVPVGGFLRRIIILVQDDTATRPVRADDEITGVRIRLPKTGRTIFTSAWEDLKARTAARYGYKGAVWQQDDVTTGSFAMLDGVAVIDFRDFDHPLYGLDLRGFNTGDVKLGLTVENYTSGDDTLIWYDKLVPYPAG
jgi:hypothetical protein